MDKTSNQMKINTYTGYEILKRYSLNGIYREISILKYLKIIVDKKNVKRKPRTWVPHTYICSNISRYLPKKNENTCPQKHIHMIVHNSISYNSPKPETIQMYPSWFMDKYIGCIYRLWILINWKKTQTLIFGSDGKESTCNSGDLGSIPGWGISPGEGNGNPLQYSGLENSMDCIVHGVARVGHDWATFTYKHWYMQ